MDTHLSVVGPILNYHCKLFIFQCCMFSTDQLMFLIKINHQQNILQIGLYTCMHISELFFEVTIQNTLILICSKAIYELPYFSLDIKSVKRTFALIKKHSFAFEALNSTLNQNDEKFIVPKLN